jgi:hypothetical protein
MTRDDIIRMAEEAGTPIDRIGKTGALRWPDLERFAALVAAAERSSNDVTIRDYFAARAMQAYCSDPSWTIDCDMQQTANAAYLMADAMLEVRKK